MRTVSICLVMAAAGLLFAQAALAGIIADIKANNCDGAIVEFAGVIKADFPDGVYIQDPDHGAGIKVVMPGQGLTTSSGLRMRTDQGQDIFYIYASDKRTFGGQLQTDSNGERYIRLLPGLTATIVVDPVYPLVINNCEIGGADFSYSSVCGKGQKGIAPSFGPNNIGLFVQTSGTVMGSDPIQRCFYIDDGTCPFDGSGRRRIMVSYANVMTPFIVPAKYSKVWVRGISSVYLCGGKMKPVIRMRSGGDVWSAVARPCCWPL